MFFNILALDKSYVICYCRSITMREIYLRRSFTYGKNYESFQKICYFCNTIFGFNLNRRPRFCGCRSFHRVGGCHVCRDARWYYHCCFGRNLAYSQDDKTFKPQLVLFLLSTLLLHSILFSSSAFADCYHPSTFPSDPSDFVFGGYHLHYLSTAGYIGTFQACGSGQIFYIQDLTHPFDSYGASIPAGLPVDTVVYLAVPSADSEGSCICSGGLQGWTTYKFQIFGTAAPADSDGDGYDDDHDPFPDDSHCPGDPQSLWSSSGHLTCEGGCTVNKWHDTTGHCPDMITTNCPSSVLQDDQSCAITISASDTLKSASELTGSGSESADVSATGGQGSLSTVDLPDPTDTPDTVDVPDTVKGAGGSSGTADPADVQDADNKIIADYLSALQGSQSALVDQLKDLNTYQQAQTQQDVKYNQAVSDLTDYLKAGGDVPPAKQQSDYDSNIDLSQYGDAGQQKDIGGLLDDFISSSPIIAAIKGTRVQISGSSCSVGCTIFGRSISLNFCSGSVLDLLDTIGPLFVSICTIAFFFIAFA